jgi:hypothetical protein
LRGRTDPSVTPAQVTIPWDLPVEIPWRIPGAPTEITPLPFDFPGAERKRPPLPTNPFPRAPKNGSTHTDIADDKRRRGILGQGDPDLGRVSGVVSLGKYLSDAAGMRFDRYRQSSGEAMTDKITHEDVDRQFHLLRKNPEKFLELTNSLVEQRPNDALAYFSRHWAWEKLGCPELALADLDKSLTLQEHHATHGARGDILRGLGRYREAVDAYDRSQRMAPMEWQGGFGPLFRADCQARLGHEEAALADLRDITRRSLDARHVRPPRRK